MFSLHPIQSTGTSQLEQKCNKTKVITKMPESIFKFGTNKLLQFCLMIFYLHGMWPQKNSTISYTIAGYFFQSLTTYAWTTAKCIATLMLEKRSEIILLTPTSIYGAVTAYRGFIIMTKFEAIDKCLHAISDFTMNKVEYEIIQKKIKRFSRTPSAYGVFILMGFASAMLTPALSDEKIMPVPIWVPFLDWEASDTDYYIGLTFSFMGIYSLVILCCLSPILVWYLLYASSLTLEVLGYRLQNIGHATLNQEKSYEELISCLKLHQEIIDNIQRIERIFSNAFFLQITISAICVCSVTYLIASESLSDNVNNFMMYFSLLGIYGYEIFVLIYYANQIALVSDKLSHWLYESNWINMSMKFRKTIIIYVEQLKRPKELTVGKVFPMRINLLTSILNVAYSIFNVLGKYKM